MKKTLDYEDLRKMVYLSSPAVDPEGVTAAYVTAKADDSGRFPKHVYWMDLRGGEPVLLTEEEADRPAFSPDGERIAYLRKGKTDRRMEREWHLPRPAMPMSRKTGWKR